MRSRLHQLAHRLPLSLLLLSAALLLAGCPRRVLIGRCFRLRINAASANSANTKAIPVEGASNGLDGLSRVLAAAVAAASLSSIALIWLAIEERTRSRASNCPWSSAIALSCFLPARRNA